MTLLVQGVTVHTEGGLTGLVRETACQGYSACKCVERDMYRHSLEIAGVVGVQHSLDWWLERRLGDSALFGKGWMIQK